VTTGAEEEAVTPETEAAATPELGTEPVGLDGSGDEGGSATTGTEDGTEDGTEGETGGSEEDTETPSSGCGTARELMNGRRTIQSGGMNREYILRVPDDYDNGRPYRLILAYHWLNGNANQVANGGMGGSTEDPYYGLWDLAENSTIFVAPEGLDAGWANTGGRDLILTDAIVEEVLGDLCIDSTRIFATGFSYGAGMSHALACARADVFRGVALYAGAQLSGCDGGTTPIAYFHAHGVRDSVLSFENSGVPLRDRYVALNGCTPQNPPAPAALSGTHICTSYEGCSEGHPVRWCAHGGDHNPTEYDQGQSESWVPGEAWAFISQF
jgi:poly(3-hydroxybutyrate) depolymerase